MINEYTKILSVQNADTTDVDSVEVIDPGIFFEGDTVLFIVMKGAEYNSPLNTSIWESWGYIQDINNTGIYNILLVNKISNGYIIFTTRLRRLSTKKPGEVYQLVKVRGGQSVYEVNEPHTCKPWDPFDGTGGVFALIAGRKIVLNDIIDVTGKGFLGGDPNDPSIDYFEGNCSEAVDSFYTEAASDSSGRKGESFVYDGFPLTRGMFYNLTGGGGGNGKYSGGGGGGNYGTGGNGGKESESCSPVINLGGLGNYETDFYTNPEYPNRIFMGGGGGTGTQYGSLRFATKGGNGGGIIILITDTIEAKGAGIIRAKGQTVTDTAIAGAGGGGGGGVIILEANKYIGTITVNVEGGDGGWTNDISDPTGPGGFGGGGVIWYSGNSLPANVTMRRNNGKPGQHSVEGLRGAWSSSSQIGGVINKLMIPLSGFLFNVMPEDQDICEGYAPLPFIASLPKGGNGPGSYIYKWQRSADRVNWSNAPGKNDSIYYVSSPLTDTTYFRRIVESGATKDTSLILTINVLPALQNNIIAPDDTICFGSVAPGMKDEPTFGITGGNGIYTFLWESRTGSTSWTSTGITDTILRGTKPSETTYYHRIVTSHVCIDVSDSLTMTVLETIQNNLISRDDTICEDDNGLPVIGQSVSGGDGLYRYLWQSSMNSSSWIPAKIPNDLEDYDPDTLKSTRYYRRLVYSGADDACIDTSNSVRVLVHPLISSNLIDRDTIICADDPNLMLVQRTGSVGGGDGIKYFYEWQSKPQGGNWAQAGLADTLIYYEPGYLTDTVMYRRLVVSGACSDISNEIEVLVQDSILNNLIADNDTICKGAIPNPITGQSVPTGGNGIYAYQWQERLNSTGWEDIQGAIQPGFDPPSLNDTTYYRRRIVSGKCFHYSDFATVIVQDPIGNNIIKNGYTDETCYETSLLLDGTAGVTEMTGGDEVVYMFSWGKSNDNINWSEAPGIFDQENYSTEDLLLPAYYRRSVESGACTNISDSVFISINPRPTGGIVNAIYQALCYDSETGPVEIPIQYMFTGTPPFNLVYWDGFDDDTVKNMITVEGIFTANLTTTDTTFYEIELAELVDANGCFAYTDSLSGLVSAVLYKRPGAQITKEADTIQVCADLIQLEAQKEAGIGYWIKIAGDDNLTIDDTTSVTIQASTVFNDKNSQYYKLYWNNINWPVEGEDMCSSRDSVEVIFWQEPDPANARSRPLEEYDTIIYFADHMYLYADPPTAGTGKWTLISGTAVIENDTLYNSFVDLGNENLDETVEYQFLWTITNGICRVTSDELRISRRDLRIYEGFSPDDNRVNDFFMIEGLDYADTYDLKIFTRSGNLIKRMNKGVGEEGLPGNRLWDGTYDGGRPVENGIYYYTLEVKKGDQGTYQYRGYIVITREHQ